MVEMVNWIEGKGSHVNCNISEVVQEWAYTVECNPNSECLGYSLNDKDKEWS